MTRLSHSSKEKYLNCHRQWHLHYIEKLRSTYLPSSLFFGGAMDEAFGILLLSKKKHLTKDELVQSKLNPNTVLLKKLLKVNIAGKDEYIAKSLKAKYFNGDYDKEFIESHVNRISKYGEELEIFLEKSQDIDDFVMQCRAIFKKKVQIDQTSQLLYNYIHWIALYDKGCKLLDAYNREVIPLIHEVISIQEKVNLPNDRGDNIIGYIDFVASFVDDPSKVYIVDNKTSSKAYKPDSVQTSAQLSTYCEYKETDNAAYIVVEKKFRKREPRIRISILKDSILDETFDKTFKEFEETLSQIKCENFDENRDNCFQYGQKCVYYNLCREGNDSGLTKIK